MDNKKELGVVLGCFAMLLLMPVIMVASIFISGYTIQHLWGWFIVPLGLPVIGYLHAAGIGALFHFMSPFIDVSTLAKKETEKPTIQAITSLVTILIARPGMTLLFGYLIHSYMV